jgi:predicted esterase
VKCGDPGCRAPVDLVRALRVVPGAVLLLGCTAPPPAKHLQYSTSPGRAIAASPDTAPPRPADTSPPLLDTAPPPEPTPAAEPRYDPSLPTEVPVEGDLVALAAHGAIGNRRAIVYLHGVCGDIHKYRSWSDAAVRFGTVVAVRGDDRCDEPGRFKWGASVTRTDHRIVAAVRAVGEARGAGLDAESITLVGYSQGSARAEALVRALPSRYPRAVLVAGPKEHAPASFRGALGIAFVAGEKDAKTHLVESADKAARAGVRARYFELPGARHGEYGPEAVRRMGEALAWVFAD